MAGNQDQKKRNRFQTVEAQLEEIEFSSQLMKTQRMINIGLTKY